MLPFPVKIYPFEIFTRAMPGSSLVLDMDVRKHCKQHPTPERSKFILVHIGGNPAVAIRKAKLGFTHGGVLV